MLEEPTLLNKGAKPFKFIEKKKNKKEDKEDKEDKENKENKENKEDKKDKEDKSIIKDIPCCENRNGYSFISFNYDISQIKNYRKYIPYYMRYVDPNSYFLDYNVAISTFGVYGCCLRNQINGALNLELLNLEEIFNVFVPSINITNPLEIKYKDTIRNQFISFCLNIEKTYLFYNEGKLTCNNLLVPWASITPFGLNNYVDTFDASDEDNRSCDKIFIYVDQYLFNLLDQYNIYTLSVNYFEIFNNTSRINYETILKIAYNKPYDRTNTNTNFFQIINYTYSLMSFLYGTSRTLLLGLETGLSKLFIETFFPRNRQLYYYNLYNSWIISRIQYNKFGNRINSSNGDGTFVQIPQQQFAGWKTSWN
jgi:hypothetical protein